MQENFNQVPPLPEAGGASQVPPQIPPPESPAKKIFFGPHRLRAGWRLLIYVAMVAVLVFLLGSLAAVVFPAPHGVFRARSLLANELVLFLAVLIPALIMSAFEKRSLAHYGLPVRELLGKNFWVGALWGIASLSVLMAALHGAHAFDYGNMVLHGAWLIKWAVFWGVFFLIVGLFEEFAFRGYTLYTLTTGMGFWPAAVILSAAFGSVHLLNGGEAVRGGLSAGLIGLFLCLTVRRTGSLWWAIGFHQSFDWGETFLYSVPNSGMKSPGHLLNSVFHGPDWLSGGSVGPEGSVVVFALIGLLFVAFDRLYREAKYPIEPGTT